MKQNKSHLDYLEDILIAIDREDRISIGFNIIIYKVLNRNHLPELKNALQLKLKEKYNYDF